MKAERRHELETNSLAVWLRWRLPEIWQAHGTTIMLVVIAAILAGWLISWRLNAPKIAAATAMQHISAARQQMDMLSMGMASPEQQADIEKNLAAALTASDRADLQAITHVLRGDYYWQLATATEPLLATTQPSEKPDKAESLDKAQEGYQSALATNVTLPDVVARARIGLGSIAEQRGYELMRQNDPQAQQQFQLAREQYQAVVDAPEMLDILKNQARWHLEQLEQLQKPVWVVQAPSATQPAEAAPAATLGPELPAATTQPDVAPASPAPVPAPSTQPVQ